MAAESANGCRDSGNSTITKSLFEDKMKDACLHKLTITECSHQATQFKKIHNALPVLCTDKGFRFISDIICTNKELLKTNHLTIYPDANLWLRTMNLKINLIDPLVPVDTQTGARPIIKVVAKKTHVFDTNM